MPDAMPEQATASAQPPTEPPADRFCDLVMKGGITSGVVYPGAIERLSHHYHFKSIGGTSAGAIAAAVTAAAEYQRRQSGSRAGFDLLRALPDELKREVKPGQRKLLSLFQAQPGTRRLFSVLVTALNSGGTWQRVGWVLMGAFKAYWLAVLVSVLLAAWALVAAGTLAALLSLVLLLIITIGGFVYFDISKRVVPNGFGLCTGLTEDAQHPALTPWLHGLIQQAAGLPAGADPLTFGQLWAAKGGPVERYPPPASVRRKSIDLQMFSTNLGHGRPYIFPLAEHDDTGSRFRSQERLFFSPAELARYLPDDVLQWMCKQAKPYVPEPTRAGRDPTLQDAATLGLVGLPPPEHFPVILAARMSLSFPFLFAALPLWAIDHDPAGRAQFRRCWFSDGGISSNFPMHLFDGLVPAWPTFGINLEDKIPGREDMVYLPQRYDTGHGERWNRFDAPGAPGATRFGGFLSAILGAMQNWNDNALSRMPGVRDRIARVRLDKNEGGLNLNMEAKTINDVAERGEAAVQQLIDRFVPAADGAPSAGWDEQRWVRLGVLLKMVQERAPAVLTALDSQLPHATPLATLIERAGLPAAAPLAGYEAPLTAPQQQALQAVVNALGLLVGTLAQPGCSTDFKPVPRPELRVRPPL